MLLDPQIDQAIIDEMIDAVNATGAEVISTNWADRLNTSFIEVAKGEADLSRVEQILNTCPVFALSAMEEHPDRWVFEGILGPHGVRNLTKRRARDPFRFIYEDPSEDWGGWR